MKQSYEKIFKLALVIIIVLNIFYMFPPDDGLRHMGLAFDTFTSWGDVYPFSIFEEFKDYNPWFGYDLALRIIAEIYSYQKHFVAILFDILLPRYGQIRHF
jgi:hypothetical protein